MGGGDELCQSCASVCGFSLFLVLPIWSMQLSWGFVVVRVVGCCFPFTFSSIYIYNSLSFAAI